MRSSEKPASLKELLGKAGDMSDIGLKDLGMLLGEKMPEIPRNRIGRFRLVNALQQRFGAGFRNIEVVNRILKEFDEEVEMENTVRMNNE